MNIEYTKFLRNYIAPANAADLISLAVLLSKSEVKIEFVKFTQNIKYYSKKSEQIY